MIVGFAVFVTAVGCMVGYRISLSWFPYTRCGRCEGSGRRGGSTAVRFGPCRKCKGSGRKERFGRRFLGIGRDDR